MSQSSCLSVGVCKERASTPNSLLLLLLLMWTLRNDEEAGFNSLNVECSRSSSIGKEHQIESFHLFFKLKIKTHLYQLKNAINNFMTMFLKRLFWSIVGPNFGPFLEFLEKWDFFEKLRSQKGPEQPKMGHFQIIM